MIADLSRGITAAMQVVELNNTASTAMRKKLVQLVIDPLLKSATLDQLSQLRQNGHAYMIDEVIREMTLAQLKAVSKKWNPHFKLPKEPIMRELQVQLRDLAAGRIAPAPAPEPRTRPARPRAKRAAVNALAAE